MPYKLPRLCLEKENSRRDERARLCTICNCHLTGVYVLRRFGIVAISLRRMGSRDVACTEYMAQWYNGFLGLGFLVWSLEHSFSIVNKNRLIPNWHLLL